jgi:hypothetical protein
MELTINKREANVIQVALDHLYEMHSDVLKEAIDRGDANQARESYHIQRIIEDIQGEIIYQLKNK